MDDLKHRAREAFLYLNDDKLQFWEKIKNTLSSFSGLDLTNIPDGHKKWLTGELSRINAIFSKYDIKTHQDYEKLTGSDRKKLLNILATMCVRIIEKK